MDWAEWAATVKLDTLPLAGIVTVIVGMILTGRLYSGRAYDAKAAECEDWKQAFFKSDEANHVQREQISDLIRANRTTEHLLKSMPENGGGS